MPKSFQKFSFFSIKYVLFWLLVFCLFRIIFLEIFHVITNVNIPSVIEMIRFDSAVISFFVLAQLVFFFIVLVLKKDMKRCFLACNFIFILVHNLLAIIDIYMYHHWQSRLNLKALIYFSHPIEILKNITYWSVISSVLFWGMSSFLFYRIFRWLFKHSKDVSFSLVQKIIGLLGIITLSIIGIRGGVQEIPINLSYGFVTNHNALNYGIINPLWNVANVLFEKNQYLTHNPYKKMPDSVSDYWVQEYYKKKDVAFTDFFDFDSSEKPNICFIVMEGVNEVCLSDEMPFLNSLKKEGLYFDNCFANGYRTEQGLTSILSGEIPLPYHSIVDNVASLSKYPSLYKDFKSRGYFTQFYFGGESEFGNIKSYLSINNVDEIVDIHQFTSEDITQKLGVNDAVLFREYGKKLTEISQPFFSVILTQSTHEPFDIEQNANETDEVRKYKNTVHYLDQQLSDFFNSNKSQPWFKNTIFLILSDHSNRLPGNYGNGDKEFFKIPFILYSQKLLPSYKNKIKQKFINQSDIPTTLSYIMKYKTNDYFYSRNYFDNSQKHFAHVSFVDGSGVFEDNSYEKHDYRYHFTDTSYHLKHFKGYAILQHVSNRFIEKK